MGGDHIPISTWNVERVTDPGPTKTCTSLTGAQKKGELTYMWHLKKKKINKKQSTKVLNPGHRLVFAEGGLWVCEVGEGGQKAQTSNYRKVTPGIIMCSMATIANNTILKNYSVYLKVAERVDLKSPHHTHRRCRSVR